MIDFGKGWLKIFLFYGVIFFLLGLSGYLATDGKRWTTWSAGQIRKVNQVWSTFILNISKNQAVPAFSNLADAIVFEVYPGNSTNQQFANLIHQMQRKLRSRFQHVLTMPVVNLNKLDFIDGNPLAPWILVGFDQTDDPGQVCHDNLYFSMADQNSSPLAGKLIQTMATKLPMFTFEKLPTGRTAIFKLSWISTDDGGELDNQVFTSFSEIIIKDSFQTIPNKTLD